jgi:hypothetical protein
VSPDLQPPSGGASRTFANRWRALRCAAHGSPDLTTDAELRSEIDLGRCPACPTHQLVVTKFVLAAQEGDGWYQCPCCESDWKIGEQFPGGWAGLNAATRAQLLAASLLSEG